MAPKPKPPHLKKIEVKASIDPDVYEGIKDEPSMSEWIARACRMRWEAEKGKRKPRKEKDRRHA